MSKHYELISSPFLLRNLASSRIFSFPFGPFLKMNNATSPRSNFSAMLFIYLFPSSPLLHLTTLRMKSGHRIAVTAMSNISFCQFWLLSPPPHLMSLYSPEGAVGMKGRGLAADLRGRRVLKDGSEREGEGWREREREGAVFPAESQLSGLAG